ncbi:A24 family peptidase [Nocardioides sp. Kera G14]|uniref:prepilin peptidase n=1 Tax=Nocardioides sp. Kera G14 TaxID=2884264 RepID=UPI001D0FA1E0|nr:A24 family peptidase [Nocardioides sp. Kera G14]UDY22163.1 A24 family peptidase [Nocardioides sp. Kera G14]
MHVVPALICLVLGAIAGLIAPRLIAATPDIEPDATENPEDFPDPVAFAELGARPGLRIGTAVAGAVAGGVLGLVFGLVWGVAILLVAFPFAIALAVIDFVTWFLPDRLILPAAIVVVVADVAAAIGLTAPELLLHALLGGVGLLAWYGVIWFISPRAMAFGDVKLAGVIGLALGPWGLTATVVSVFLAAVLSMLALLPMRLLGRTINQGGTTSALRAHIPYGPSMLVGAWAAVLAARALMGG